jgi:uncharacterized protein (TIGR04255 family)
MARPRAHLRNAPIAEAVVDFRVVPREDVTAETFANLQARLGPGYTDAILMQSFQAQFGMDQGRFVAPPPITSAVGWRYGSTTLVAQFRVDGFTFSKLEPYTTWEQVFGEAMRGWGLYVELAQPLEVSRLAVRYINRLRVPGPADLREYLTSPPALPPPIPQALREFLTRTVVDDRARGISAIIIQALEPSLDPAMLSLLFDTDAFREVALPPGDASIPAIFGDLRSLKNTIFFASITERAAEMYE